MLEEIVWVLKALVLPPGGLIMLGLIGLSFSRRSFLGGLLLILSLAGLYLASSPYVADRLMAQVEIYPALQPNQVDGQQAQAILLLCGGRRTDAPEYAGDTVNGLSLARLRYAARIWRQTGLPLIVSGGSADPELEPESELVRQVLQEEFSVPVTAVENTSRTTWENARMSKQLLLDLGIDRVFLVTHAMHMPRAMQEMSRAGIDAIAAPTGFHHRDDDQQELSDWLPSAKAMQFSYFALHELLGRLWYRIRALQ